MFEVFISHVYTDIRFGVSITGIIITNCDIISERQISLLSYLSPTLDLKQ